MKFDENAACQERILQTFVPTIIAVGLIAITFMVFSLAFDYIFYKIHLLMSLVCSALLFIVALRIYLIPRATARYHQQWLELLDK